MEYPRVNVYIDVENAWGNSRENDLYINGGFSTSMLVYPRYHQMISSNQFKSWIQM